MNIAHMLNFYTTLSTSLLARALDLRSAGVGSKPVKEIETD